MKRDDEAWRQAATRLAAAKAARDAAEAEYRAALDAATLLAPDGAEGFGVRVTQVLRSGVVAYARAVRELLPDADLSAYRGDPTLIYRVEVSHD